MSGDSGNTYGATRKALKGSENRRAFGLNALEGRRRSEIDKAVKGGMHKNHVSKA